MTGGFSWYLPEVNGLLQAGWCQKCGMGWLGGLPLEERDESTKVYSLTKQCQDISPSIHSIPSTVSILRYIVYTFIDSINIVQKVRPAYFFWNGWHLCRLILPGGPLMLNYGMRSRLVIAFSLRLSHMDAGDEATRTYCGWRYSKHMETYYPHMAYQGHQNY